MRMKLTLSMEQEDLSAYSTEDETGIEPASDSVETSLINEENERRSIDELATAIDDSGEGIEQLEEVRERLEDTVDEGGASPETVEMARVAVESVYRKVGLKSNRILSKENFQSNARRIGSTKIAIEGIGDTVKRIWKSIVEAVKKMWEKVKKWWNSYFDDITKMEEKAKKIQKRLESLTADMVAKKDEKGNTAFEAAGFVKSVGEIAKKAGLRFGWNDEVSKFFTEKQKETIREKINDISKVGGFMLEYVNSIKDTESFKKSEPLSGNTLSSLGYKKSDRGDVNKNDDQDIYTSMALAGYQLAIVVPSGKFGEGTFTHFESKVEIVPEFLNGHYYNDVILPYGINLLLKMKEDKTLTEMVNVLKENKKAMDSVEKAMDKLISIVDKFISGADDSDKEDLSDARKSVMSFSSFGAKFNTSALSLLKKYANIILNYVEISIPRYVKPDAKA